MCANLAGLLELLWTMVGLFHVLSNISPMLLDWAFKYKRNAVPSLTGQATGQSSGSGSQPVTATVVISASPQSGVCLAQGSLSY